MAGLLEGTRVVDLAGEPAAMAGRLLADLGAEVVTVVRSGGADPERRGDELRDLAWSVGHARLALDDGADEELGPLLGAADVVVETPGWPGVVTGPTPTDAPGAVWIRVTPFGSAGPRAGWRASDLGVLAAAGNLYATGDPDRAPVRCAEPVAWAHTGPEVVVAALTALATGRPQVVDLSMAEAVLVANMGAVGRYHREGDRGRRRGASIGRTREIWPCADGWVSFGIRGGRARVGTWATVVELARADGIDVGAVEHWDWATFNHNAATDDELDELSRVVEQWVGRHTLRELYGWACEHNLTLAPVNDPPALLASEQLAARSFFVGDDDPRPAGLPRRVVTVRSPGDAVDLVEPPTSPPEAPTWAPRPGWWRHDDPPGSPWAGTTILEFGAGAAGPVATRYFAEHGATVIRVESSTRPDFLRAYALGPKNPHGLEGSALFDALNPGKRSITLNLKHPEGNALARRLVVEHADAVAENFAPKGMTGLRLDWDTLSADRPDLVMVSSCLNGHTGPHRDYPGFGSQGAALSGYTFLTGWPDRPPVGPFGTITDSLAPRFVASALAAGLLHRRRTGAGVYLDVAQVEAAVWSLAPWILRWSLRGEIGERVGNRHPRAAPHGVYPCRGDDRWVAIAVWTDDEWTRLAAHLGLDRPGLTSMAARRAQADELDALLADWTATRDATEVAEQLQGLGLEAVPVADFGDCYADPQLAHRGHLVALDHPALGEGRYERNGFRLAQADGGYDRPSPLLGQDTEWVLGELLGLSGAEQGRLRADGALD